MKLLISPLLGGVLSWEIDDANPNKMDFVEKLHELLLRGDLGQILIDCQPSLVKETRPL